MKRMFADWEEVEEIFETETPLQKLELVWNVRRDRGDLLWKKVVPICDDAAYARLRQYADHLVTQPRLSEDDSAFVTAAAVLMHERGELSDPRYDDWLAPAFECPRRHALRVVTLVENLPGVRRRAIIDRHWDSLWKAPYPGPPKALRAIREGHASAAALALDAAWYRLAARVYRADENFENLLRSTLRSSDKREKPDIAWASVASFLACPRSTSRSSVNSITSLLSNLAELRAPLRWALKSGLSAQEASLHGLLAGHEKRSEIEHELWLPVLGSSSKVSRQLAEQQLAKIEHNIFAQLLHLLCSRKKNTRRAAAALLLSHPPPSREPIEKALGKEKFLEVTSALERALASLASGKAEATPTQASPQTESHVLEMLRDTRKKRLPAWLGQLPPIGLADGTPIEGDALAGLLARLSLEGPEHHDMQLATADFDGENFSLAILDAWQGAGKGGTRDHGSGPSWHKWAVYQQVFFVDDTRIEALGKNIVRWGSNNPHLATWNLQWLSRRAGSAAEQVLASVAVLRARGKVNTVARELLETRSIDLGVRPIDIVHGCALNETTITSEWSLPADAISEEGIAIDYGRRQFWGRFDQAGELQPHDAEGKKLKSLPKPGKKDDLVRAQEARAEFSSAGKRFSKEAARARQRLESMMASQERLSSELMTRSFHGDTLLRAIGRGLIFRSQSGTLFRPENGEWLGVGFEPIAFGDGETFGIPHPLELSEEERSAWREHIEDAQVIEPFLQLDRPTFDTDHNPLGVMNVTPGALTARLRARDYIAEEYGNRARKPFLARRGQIHLEFKGVGPISSTRVKIERVCWQDLLGNEAGSPDAVAWSEVCFDLKAMGDSRA